jgi:hypothetical protein
MVVESQALARNFKYEDSITQPRPRSRKCVVYRLLNQISSHKVDYYGGSVGKPVRHSRKI